MIRPTDPSASTTSHELVRRPPIDLACLLSFLTGVGVAAALSLIEVVTVVGVCVAVVAYPATVVTARMSLGPNRVRTWVRTVHTHVLGSVLFGVAGGAAIVTVADWYALNEWVIVSLLAVIVLAGGFGYLAVSFTGVFRAGHTALRADAVTDDLRSAKADVRAEKLSRLGLEVYDIEFQDADGGACHARLLSGGERVLPGGWVLYRQGQADQPVRVFDSLRERP